MSRLPLRLLSLTCLIAFGCAGQTPSDAPRELTIYSGRNEKLIGPLLDRFRESSGIEVQVRYANTAELAATLMEEGSNSPADLFISQDAGALGALSRLGLLRPLPDDVVDRLPARFRSGRGDWIGLSGRARVVTYNTSRTTPDDLPQALEQVGDPKFRGRFGVAPTNASFQSHMALYLALNGEQALTDLLAAITANEPRTYNKNSEIVGAVIAGEIDFGLTNHYYLWRVLSESPDAPGSNFFMPAGDASSFVNMAGAGLLSDNPAALELMRYMSDPEAQRYFAEETYEYPLLSSVAPSVELPALDALATPDVDYADVGAALERAQALIHDSGLNRFQ